MAVGNSNKVVIELPPGMKEQVHAAIKARGSSLKQWFIEQATQDLLSNANPSKTEKKEGDRK